MNIEEIKNEIRIYEKEELFEKDPVSFLWRYKEKRDIEVAAVICSVLAFGNRNQIYKTCEKTLALMGDSPYEYIKSQSFTEYQENWTCWYRMLKWTDFFDICKRLSNIYSQYEDMEEWICDRLTKLDYGYLGQIVYFFADINGFPQDTKSCCKRVNLMLRWLVRQGSSVDIGIWTKLDQSKLLLPMDTHSLNTARKHRILKRKSNDMKAVIEVTEWAKTIYSDDPASLDFFLFGESYTEAHPDETKVKMTPNQMILTAIYQTIYLNELVCCCIHDIKPSIGNLDKEAQKIFKAALKRVREYEKWMHQITKSSGNVYVDYCDEMDCKVQPFLETLRTEIYNLLNARNDVEMPYVSALIILARSMVNLSIVEIGNRVKDTLKYDETAISLYDYQQKELLTILENLIKWFFRKVPDINLNDSPECVKAYIELLDTINNSDIIAMSIVKAQQLNDKENESKN